MSKRIPRSDSMFKIGDRVVFDVPGYDLEDDDYGTVLSVDGDVIGVQFDGTSYMSFPNLEHLRLDVEDSVIDDQTIMFWNLQLQFMEMRTADLVDLFLSLNPCFNRTKHVKKSYRKCLKWLSDYNLFDLNQDEHNYIATTLAIQLSGLA